MNRLNLKRAGLSLVMGVMVASSTSVAAQDTSPLYVPRPASPSELKRASESKDPQTSEEGKDQATSSSGLELMDDFVVYPRNTFLSKKGLEAFAKKLDQDSRTKGQFEVEDVSNDETYELEVRYAADADPDKEPIVLYQYFGFDKESEAQDFVDQSLKEYPDLFFAGEVVPSFDRSGKYDIAFGLRPGVDSFAFDVDLENKEIFYTTSRKPFTYEYEEGEEDPYQAAIEAAFPGQFEFEEETVGGKNQVTMNQVSMVEEDTQEQGQESDTQATSADRDSDNSSKGFFSKVKDTLTNWITAINLNQTLINLGVPKHLVRTVIIVGVIALILIGLLLIVLGKR